MAVGKNTIVECDVCGFEYRRKVMKKIVMDLWFVLKTMKVDMI